MPPAEELKKTGLSARFLRKPIEDYILIHSRWQNMQLLSA